MEYIKISSSMYNTPIKVERKNDESYLEWRKRYKEIYSKLSKKKYQRLLDFINSELIPRQMNFEFKGYGEVRIKVTNNINWILGMSKIIEKWQSTLDFNVEGDAEHFDVSNFDLDKNQSNKNKKENNGFKK